MMAEAVRSTLGGVCSNKVAGSVVACFGAQLGALARYDKGCESDVRAAAKERLVSIIGQPEAADAVLANAEGSDDIWHHYAWCLIGKPSAVRRYLSATANMERGPEVHFLGGTLRMKPDGTPEFVQDADDLGPADPEDDDD